MGDPRLKRAVWLTVAQRERLKQATERALLTGEADETLCNAILYELEDVVERDVALTRLIRATIRGLKLPTGMSPVFLCTAETEEVLLFGNVDEALSHIISSRPRPPKLKHYPNR